MGSILEPFYPMKISCRLTRHPSLTKLLSMLSLENHLDWTSTSSVGLAHLTCRKQGRNHMDPRCCEKNGTEREENEIEGRYVNYR